MAEHTSAECYTDKHETNIYAAIASDGTAYCVDHAVQVLFDGDIEAFERVDNGTDISFIDKHGNPFGLVHEFTNSYAQSDDEYYPEGLYCEFKDDDGECHAELVPPREEYDDEDEFDPENTDEDF